jgi:hypothetical protein
LVQPTPDEHTGKMIVFLPLISRYFLAYLVALFLFLIMQIYSERYQLLSASVVWTPRAAGAGLSTACQVRIQHSPLMHSKPVSPPSQGYWHRAASIMRVPYAWQASSQQLVFRPAFRYRPRPHCTPGCLIPFPAM